jgi:hypothetical protein
LALSTAARWAAWDALFAVALISFSAVAWAGFTIILIRIDPNHELIHDFYAKYYDFCCQSHDLSRLNANFKFYNKLFL